MKLVTNRKIYLQWDGERPNYEFPLLVTGPIPYITKYTTNQDKLRILFVLSCRQCKVIRACFGSEKTKQDCFIYLTYLHS